MTSPNTTPQSGNQQSGNQQSAAPVADPSAYAAQPAQPAAPAAYAAPTASATDQSAQPVPAQPQYAQYQQPAAFPSTMGVAPGSAPATTPVATAGTASNGDFFTKMARIVIAQPALSLAALIGVIGAAVSILGCFLPFASVFGYSFNYFGSGLGVSGDGFIVLILMVLTAVFLFFPKKGFAITAVVLSALNVLVPLFDAANKPSSGYVHMSIGFFVVILGALAALFGSIVQLLLITKGLVSAPQSGTTAPVAAQGAPLQASAPVQPVQFAQPVQQAPVQQTMYAAPVATADATVPAAAPAAYAAPVTDAQSVPAQPAPAQTMPVQPAQPAQPAPAQPDQQL